MKRRALIPFLLVMAGSLGAEEVKKQAAEEMLQGYIEAARPVAEHDRLRSLSGSWNVTSRLWFGPGHEPVTGRGTATGRMILGNRFLQIDSTVDQPLPAEAMTILGFDRRTSDYTMVGFDTLGTYYVTAAGKYDEREKAVVLSGSYARPPSGREQTYRFVWDTPSETEHVLKLYFATPEGETLVAETRYTRPR
ncbi:MAG TPA: DUF1579 family protein [Thermoanaerobaculia bacterium]|nr:DUF1579 family protein [Thermoanaerobaculia bacterium]